MDRYSEYKDSGVKWLGEIPSHWNVLPGLAVFSENKEKNSNLTESCVLSLSYGKIIVKKDIDEGLVPADYKSYQIVHPGYTIIRCTDLQNDRISLRTGLVRNDGIITGAYLGLIPNGDNNFSYIHYFLHTWDITKEIYRHGSGLRQSLSWLDLRRLPILLPPKEEQDKIVVYLDAETSKIDKAIEQQQRMIDLLNERKQIIINKVVTKGLNPNVKMKPSGIDWIGEIPEGWEIKHLRNFLKLFSEKGYGNCQLLSVTREKGVIIRDRENIDDNHNFIPDDLNGYKHVKKGDFVINKMKSWQGSYGVSEYDGIVSPAYFTCKLNGVNPNFFSLAVRSRVYVGFFMRYSKGIRIGQWDLDPSYLKDIPFILPGEAEQEKIVSYLKEEIPKIEKVIPKIETQISLLQERKQIIINEAITGKVKIT